MSAIAFIPSLLPVIMQNQDALELTSEQVAAFRDWRKNNYQRMVEDMNTIIEKRIALSKKAMEPSVSGHEIKQLQKGIFDLQHELLNLRLGCRKLLMETFTDEQWTNFRFIIEDYPNFAGLIE